MTRLRWLRDVLRTGAILGLAGAMLGATVGGVVSLFFAGDPFLASMVEGGMGMGFFTFLVGTGYAGLRGVMEGRWMLVLRRASQGTAVLLLGLAVLIPLTLGPPPPSANPPGAFSFAAFGDSPYSFLEDLKYRVVLRDLEAHELSVAVHVGDLFARSCTTERYQRSLDGFNGLPHPVVYTPGDNEWADCWAEWKAFAPLGRLAEIRRLFFKDPESSLGGRTIPLESQGGQGPFAEFVENVRWTHEGVLFATLHLVGSLNGMAPFPDRTEANDEKAERRMDAAVSWLHDTFAEAAATDARAVVIAFHGAPGFEEAADNPRRIQFAPFIDALREEAELFRSPVLVIHGDWHDYTVDQPIKRRGSDLVLDNLTRLQVPGSPDVGWVRVTVTLDPAQPFSFEPRVVPFWKYW